VTSSPGQPPPARRLRPAIVLGSTEDECTVLADGRPVAVPYALPFPRPRAERVTPGHLVAIAAARDGSDLVVWRWFDAVVVERAASAVALWEPNHGSVLAQPRDPQRDYRPGSRAYASAGLPGAAWWVAGPAVDRAENADVELDEVSDFFTGHRLWDRLT
jgi:hypothetical protein